MYTKESTKSGKVKWFQHCKLPLYFQLQCLCFQKGNTCSRAEQAPCSTFSCNKQSYSILQSTSHPAGNNRAYPCWRAWGQDPVLVTSAEVPFYTDLPALEQRLNGYIKFHRKKQRAHPRLPEVSISLKWQISSLSQIIC